MPSLVRRAWDWLLTEPLREADEEARRHLATHRRLDGKAMTVLMTLGFVIVLLQFTKSAWDAAAVLDAIGLRGLADSLRAWVGQGDAQLRDHIWFVGVMWWWLVIVPSLVIMLGLRERLRDFGWGLGESRRHWKAYAALFLVIVPALVLVTAWGSYQQTYPYYKPAAGQAIWPTVVLAEAAYLSVFVATEFAFRGFAVLGTRHRLGAMSAFAPAALYGLWHAGKPLTEALSAVTTAVLLGALVLRTKSLWPAAAIHVSVALTVDVLVLAR